MEKRTSFYILNPQLRLEMIVGLGDLFIKEGNLDPLSVKEWMSILAETKTFDSQNRISRPGFDIAFSEEDENKGNVSYTIFADGRIVNGYTTIKQDEIQIPYDGSNFKRHVIQNKVGVLYFENDIQAVNLLYCMSKALLNFLRKLRTAPRRAQGYLVEMLTVSNFLLGEIARVGINGYVNIIRTQELRFEEEDEVRVVLARTSGAKKNEDDIYDFLIDIITSEALEVKEYRVALLRSNTLVSSSVNNVDDYEDGSMCGFSAILLS